MTGRDDRETRETDRPPVKVTDKRRATGPRAAKAEGPVAAAESPSGETLVTDVEAVRKQADEYLEHLQRLKAEFDNYRKRVLKEQTRSVELATEPFMSKLLEVLDEFQLALVASEQEPRLDKFVRGVELVYAKLFDILRSEGLEHIDAQGKPFDPELHEALMQVGGGEGEPYVADVLRPGYMLKGRVIRPAGVKVARR